MPTICCANLLPRHVVRTVGGPHQNKLKVLVELRDDNEKSVTHGE